MHEVLGSPGQPLDPATRAFFEPRFGHDFSHVRVHTDAHAADSARAVNALAYTVGRNIAFGAGQYLPTTSVGKHLLAHELTHVVQQRVDRSSVLGKLVMNAPNNGSEREADEIAQAVPYHRSESTGPVLTVQPRLQRKCGTALGPPMPDCTPNTVESGGEVFYFEVNCDDLKPGEDTHAKAFASLLAKGATLKVHGYASMDGPAPFNWELSCHRANKMATLLGSLAPTCIIAEILKHGPTPGPAFYRRSVVVEETPRPKCGPDATDWFVIQTNLAMTDAAVLAVQADIAAADVIARRHGTTAHEVAEGGAGAGVMTLVAGMGSAAPPLAPVITGQLAAGSAAGVRAAGALMTDPLDAARVAKLIAAAALKWRALVNHGARYDFKAHTMKSPTTTHCPDKNCPDTITLCPGSAPENCYLTDLPGNLFYALIGRFVGWSELTLQLGSQLAQLTGTGAWDPPQDTAAIHLGFSLPLPMSVTGLCGVLPPARGSLTSKSGCDDCLEPTTAGYK
ncbi:MAG: eCIS core domain-containing protein [Terriglobales bacterium]